MPFNDLLVFLGFVLKIPYMDIRTIPYHGMEFRLLLFFFFFMFVQVFYDDDDNDDVGLLLR